MGTRHLICVFYRGRFVIAQYGQFDGYPEGQGLTIVAFLHGAGNIERFKEGLEHTYTPTAEEVQEFEKALAKQEQEYWADWRAAARRNVSVRDRMRAVCPSMSRETSAGILDVVAKATAEAPVPICLGLEFIHDGLFCEWAYVVDLDAEVLEVFHGLEKEREGSVQRFKGVDGAEAGWVPALVKAFAFAELPKKEADFVEAMNEALESRRRERGESLAQEEREDAGNNAVVSVL
ncbi:hypothetical protein V502_07986 [Pseudogymnoascus sp. VKM F-4520 (FW-2644)]|nr:hypothetical protein V502_07986 [Pseudogymnoascus sp. VKM F-4520 (FW-2644)]